MYQYILRKITSAYPPCQNKSKVSFKCAFGAKCYVDYFEIELDGKALLLFFSGIVLKEHMGTLPN
jgi:hypothetical protein